MRLGKTERTAARKLIRELLALPDRNNQALAKGMGVASGMISHWLLRRHLPDSKSRLKIQMYLDSLQKQPANHTPVLNKVCRVQTVNCPVDSAELSLARRTVWVMSLLDSHRQELVLEAAYLQLSLHKHTIDQVLKRVGA